MPTNATEYSNRRPRVQVMNLGKEKRIPAPIDTRLEITRYGSENLYPQEMEQIMLTSSLTVSAVDLQASFSKGQGFTENGDVILNRHNQTANDILAIVSNDHSLYNGYSLHFNFNLLGQIVEVNPVKFKYIRYGVPDDFGRHKDVKLNLNWEQDPRKLPQGSRTFIIAYPLFDPDKVQEQIAAVGFDNFIGQILYWTGEPDVYPRSSIDPIRNTSRADGEIQKFQLANITNGFLSTTLFKFPAELESDDEFRQIMQNFQELKGSENANSIIFMETPEDLQGNNFIETIPANNNDQLFEQTTANVRNTITQKFAVPPALLGVLPDSGVFTQQAMKDSFAYYNGVTDVRRNEILRTFNSWGQFWHEGELDFGDITALEFTTEDEEDADNTRSLTDIEN